MSFRVPVTAEVERLLFHMNAVAENATNTWAADFARSINAQARRKNWRPTAKQLDVMRRLVSELFIHGLEQDGGDVCVVEPY